MTFRPTTCVIEVRFLSSSKNPGGNDIRIT
jgi:hypothetical protein